MLAEAEAYRGSAGVAYLLVPNDEIMKELSFGEANSEPTFEHVAKGDAAARG
jgi:hypothetical protein